MAIKGKNKSRSRGGASRRRPAAPARPVTAPARTLPWYRTMGGQLTIILVVLAIIGIVMWRVGVAGSEASDLEARQEKLKEYTSAVAEHVGKVQETIREMLGAPFNTANPEGLADLATSTERWIESLEANGALIQEVVPPEELVAANVTLQQSFRIYSSSAKIYALVPGEDRNKKIQDLLDRAAEVREHAGVIMSSALGMLDQARREAEMGASGIDVPAQMSPILPTPAPADDAGNGAGKKDKKNDG
jgi:hypothetical protein